MSKPVRSTALALTDLPDDMIVTISGFLQGSDIARLSAVCRQLAKTLSDQYVWKTVYLKRFTLLPADQQALAADNPAAINWKERYIARAEQVRAHRLVRASVARHLLPLRVCASV